MPTMVERKSKCHSLRNTLYTRTRTNAQQHTYTHVPTHAHTHLDTHATHLYTRHCGPACVGAARPGPPIRGMLTSFSFRKKSCANLRNQRFLSLYSELNGLYPHKKSQGYKGVQPFVSLIENGGRSFLLQIETVLTIFVILGKFEKLQTFDAFQSLANTVSYITVYNNANFFLL